MKSPIPLLTALVLSLSGLVLSQAPTTKVTLRAVLVDQQLNQKPVPRLEIRMRVDGGGEPMVVHTGFDGIHEIALPPGLYTVETPVPVVFAGKNYRWNLTIQVRGAAQEIDLSNDNAVAERALSPQLTAPALAPLSEQFATLRNAVVTVWSDSAHGSGFIVDDRGMILTNDHVVQGAQYLAVQFDPAHKIVARVLAEDHDHDVALLQANTSAFPGAIAAPLASAGELAGLAPGTSVFAIGSPLNQQKILTAGIVSQIQPEALISDININHGNSGGPLFDGNGHVVGITTFMDAGTPNGPGISGIVKINAAEGALARALSAERPENELSGTLLPVDPPTPFPVDALKAVMAERKLDTGLYQLSFDGFNVTVVTPPLEYWLRSRDAADEASARSRRTKRQAEEGFDPANQLRSWMQYVGEFSPRITIMVIPQLRATFLSSLANAMERSVPLNMRFKSDFGRMELSCGDHVLAPILPGKAAKDARFRTVGANAHDVAFAGFYEYLPNAIDPACGKIRLTIFSADPKKKPATKELSGKLVQRVWDDFAPWRLAADIHL